MRSAHRKKLASDLWRVHEYLTCGDADERAWAIDEAERLLRDTVNILTALGLNTGTITVHGPPSGFPLPLFPMDMLEVVEAARGGDVDARCQLADCLDCLRSMIERAAESRRRRKPSVPTLIAQAEKSGKPVSSITTPDGVTLHFGAAESAGNEWDEVLLRHGKH
jgi:hypothetical protein